MAKKQLALGSIFKVDFTDTASFETVDLVQTITPPPRTYEAVEGDALEDTLSVPNMGIEQASRMTLTQFWEPGDVEHEKIDTWFDARDAVHNVQVVGPGSPALFTDEFGAKVESIEPAALEVSGLYSRQITLVRTTDITRT